MKEPTLEDPTQRLDHMERENRRLKRVAATVALGIAAVVLMGQARTAGRVVEAERFVLRDKSGNIRATLAVDADGAAIMGFVDRDGERRVWLGVLADGTPGLALVAKDQSARADLSMRPDGTFLLNSTWMGTSVNSRGPVGGAIGLTGDAPTLLVMPRKSPKCWVWGAIP